MNQATFSRYCAIAPNQVLTPTNSVQKVPPLYVAADEAWRLTQHRPVVVLIGSYDGSGNYGDICLFEAALSLLSTLPQAPILLPVIERQYVGSHADLTRRLAADFEPACFLYYDEEEWDQGTSLPMELTAVPRAPEFSSSAIYFYGGGYLNEMWGGRKLAMARAVDEWITSGATGRSRPLVAFTGQQVSAGFGDDPEAASWLRRASLIGVRDVPSAENLTDRLPDLDTSVLVVAQDDAVGVLGEIPELRDTIDGGPRSREGDLRLDLHLSGESYATTDPKRLSRFVADLLTALRHEAARHVSVRLVVAYEDRRITERPFLEGFASQFLTAANEVGTISFTVENATDRRIQDPRWERQRPDLTISCSYHVAMTSLLHDVPVIYLFGNDYYSQKAKSLQAGFGLSTELTVNMADPEADAATVASRALDLLSDQQRYAETINRLRLARARALAQRGLVIARLIQLLSAHMAATPAEKAEAEDQPASRSALPHGKARAEPWIALKRSLTSARSRILSRKYDGFPDHGVDSIRQSVDELRARVESLSGSVAEVGRTTEGHTEWLSDLQTWMRTCVQMLNMLADVPPITSDRAQSSAPPARRRDDIEEIKRHFQVWTTMAWVDQAVVPCDQLVSVIMPTRNRCGWIEHAIASVQAQTYGHWELVVIDDDSSDATAALVTEIAARDERIRYHHIEHAGAPAARNVGLSHARGAIVCYLDDDNLMHPGWLKSVAWAFSCWPQTEVLYGARIIEDDLALEGIRSQRLPTMRFRAWDRRRLESSNYIDQNVIAHRADLPEAHFDEALPMCQDWELMLRMTARRQPLELPVLACLYSTTAPNRGSDQPDQMGALHEVRARAHVGRPLRLLVLGRRPEDADAERIDSDIAAFAEGDAYIAVADAVAGESEAETSRFVAAVTEHDPDVVLVYGTPTEADVGGPLEAAGRPFALRILEPGGEPGPVDPLRHSLLLGVWDVPEQPETRSATRFLDDLAETLRKWKLDVSPSDRTVRADTAL